MCEAIVVILNSTHKVRADQACIFQLLKKSLKDFNDIRKAQNHLYKNLFSSIIGLDRDCMEQWRRGWEEDKIRENMQSCIFSMLKGSKPPNKLIPFFLWALGIVRDQQALEPVVDQVLSYRTLCITELKWLLALFPLPWKETRPDQCRQHCPALLGSISTGSTFRAQG